MLSMLQFTDDSTLQSWFKLISSVIVSDGSRRIREVPPGKNFIFMQFSERMVKYYVSAPATSRVGDDLWEVLDLPLRVFETLQR